jgi:hypothetical protein
MRPAKMGDVYTAEKILQKQRKKVITHMHTGRVLSLIYLQNKIKYFVKWRGYSSK